MKLASDQLKSMGQRKSCYANVPLHWVNNGRTIKHCKKLHVAEALLLLIMCCKAKMKVFSADTGKHAHIGISHVLIVGMCFLLAAT